jgi:two-component system NtrC family sensor kinase
MNAHSPSDARALLHEPHERILRRAGRLLEQNKQLVALNAIATAVNQSLDVNRTLPLALDQVLRLLELDAGIILLRDFPSDAFRLLAHRGLQATTLAPLQHVGPQDAVLSRVLSQRTSVIGEPMEGVIGRLLRREGFRFHALIPLKSKGNILGVFVLAHRRPREWDADAHQFLDSVGNIIGVALENASLYREVSNLLEATREQAERLHHSEQQLRAIIESAADAVAILQQGRFRYCNTSGLKMLGYSAEEITARDFLDLVRDDYRELVRTQYLLRKPGEPSTPHDVVLIGKDGRHIFVNINACAIEYEGQPSLLVIARDVSEAKALREQILQSEKMAALGQLISGVAHELNNPLAIIIGYSELMRVEPDLPPALASGLNAIYEAALRARRIVQNLLTFARPKQHARSLVKINDLIEGTLALRAYHLRVNNIEVIKEFDPNLPPIPADGSQLQQVLLNLIINAEQAMLEAHGRGRLTIRTQCLSPSESRAHSRQGSESWIRIAIADDGPGIPEAIIHRIFEPFFTTKPVGQGTGLGLSISHSIVQEHGGRLYVRSRPGQGATFIVELPIDQDDAGHVEPAPTLPPPSSSARSLLLVEDEPALLDLIKKLVEAEGHHTDTASDGFQALEKLRHRTYDLILCDLKMPGLSGQEVYEEIAEKWPEMRERMIFLTGDLVDPRTRAFLDRIQRPVIEKPFQVEDLVRVLREHLG